MQSLLTQLTNYAPVDSLEKTHRLHAIYALKTVPNCFNRKQFSPGHFTAAGWITTSDFNHILLIYHPVRNIWMQPGGHADDNPNLLEVAIREVEEETSLSFEKGQVACWHGGTLFDVDTHEVPARVASGKRDAEPEHLHYDMRFLFIAPSPLKLNSPEDIQLEWQSVDWCLDHFPKGGGRYRCAEKIKRMGASAHTL